MRVKSQESRANSRKQRLGLRSKSGTRLWTLDSRLSSGLTLIELLVVIIILTTLVSAAIPIMAPSNDDRRLREASRSVNAFISAAQMKAVQLQRPVGVALKRLSQDTGSDARVPHDDSAVAIELYYVEQPAPYRGFDRTSAAMVARHTNVNKVGQVMIGFVVRGNASELDGLPVGWDAELFPPNLVRPGDVIEIDGTRYRLLAPTTDNSNRVRLDNRSQQFYEQVNAANTVFIEAVPLNDTGQMLNVEYDFDGRRMRDFPVGTAPVAPFWTHPAPYKILRQPMPTSAEPLQMPEGTAIDLRASGQTIEFEGTGVNATAAGLFYNPDVPSPNQANGVNNSDPIIVMFTPEGSIERVRFNQKNVAIGTPASPAPDNIYDGRTVSNIYLLVGRRQNAPPPAITDDPTLNAADMNGKTDQQMQEMKRPVNWLLGESRWIVIGSQSGRVVTVENAFVDPRALANQYPPPVPLDVLRARQIHAAREFAREMAQTGGR